MLDKIGSNGLWFLNSRISIDLSRNDNSDGISVLVHHTPKDDAPPLHIHHDEDEIFHVLEGEIRFQVGGVLRTVGAGDTMLAPRGVAHGYRVISAGGARYITITRGGFEAMVRSVARPALNAGLPDMMAPSPEMQAELAARCAEHGIELIGPPIA